MARSLQAVGVVTLFVADLERSKEFYARAFDLTPVDDEPGTAIYQLENLFLRLLSRERAQSEMPGVPVAAADAGAASQLAIFVDDAARIGRELEERGVELVFGPIDRPWGVRNVAFRDPDGHIWVLSSDIPTD